MGSGSSFMWKKFDANGYDQIKKDSGMFLRSVVGLCSFEGSPEQFVVLSEEDVDNVP